MSPGELAVTTRGGAKRVWRRCVGCDAELVEPPASRPGRPRKWCSLACSKRVGQRRRYVPKAPRVVACRSCGGEMELAGVGSARKECERCGERLHVWKAGERRARRAGVAVERFSIPAVFERDGWECRVCGRGIDAELRYPHPMSPSVDHVVPIERGGSHTFANAQATHLRCNLEKSRGERRPDGVADSRGRSREQRRTERRRVAS